MAQQDRVDDEAAGSVAGALNQVGREMGKSLPFQVKVKNVCAKCNNGWMGDLEQVASRVITPLVLGQPGHILREDQGAISAWIQKTALMAMYLSSAAEREIGHGVAPSEYSSFYQRRDEQEPLSNSRFWVARYTGSLRLGAVWVTPLAVNVDGLSEPEFPHGYSMTIAVGALLVHGVRFTDLPFYIDVATKQAFSEIWPPEADVDWPGTVDISDDDFLNLAQGREFVLPEKELSLLPMSWALDSPPSKQVGSMVEMPTPCGQGHVIYYPAVLAEAGMRGRSHLVLGRV